MLKLLTLDKEDNLMIYACLYSQPLSAKERHVVLPLVIATFIMQSVTFITLPSQVRTMLNFLLH